MDADRIKQFFILHFEKFLVGLFLVAAAFLVYTGLQLPNFLQEHQPDKLAAQASQVKLAIDEDHTEAIIEKDQRIPTFDIVGQTKRFFRPVDSVAYKLENTWESQNEQSIVRRQDPALLPPLDLRTQGVITSIAIKGSATPDDYPLAALEAADAVEKVEPVKRISRRERRQSMMMDEGYGMEMEMEMEMMSEGYGMEMEGMAGPSGPNRKLDKKYDFGLRPTVGTDKRNPKPTIGWFIAGTALLPHREIYEAYELALKDADSYDPRRDTPAYFNLEVQRADVTDKPVEQLGEEDWVNIWHLKRYAELASGYWAGFAAEIVPEDYRESQLTIWIPPVLLDDYRPFSIHPRIPMLSQSELTKNKKDAQEAAALADIKEFDWDEEGKTELVAQGMKKFTGNPMMGRGMSPMDMGMMSGGMMMFSRGKIEKDPVEHKLLRFYDFAGPKRIFTKAPQYGHTYVYRLRYSVNDPNFPINPTMQPKTSSLAPDVAKRVLDKMAEAVKSGERDFQKWSEWSEPSEPASLPTLEEYFIGPVEAPSSSTWTVGGRPIEYERDSPKAKVVVSQFVPEYGAKVPIQFEITEGSVLSHKAESADVVDPISLKIKKLPEPKFSSSSTVIDLDGGKDLKITNDLKEPGMMLLYDQSGQLRVSEEIEDQEMYRIKSYAEEKGE